MTMEIKAKLYPNSGDDTSKAKEALEHFRGVLEGMGVNTQYNIPVLVTAEPYPVEWLNPGARPVVKIDGHIHFNDGKTFCFGFGAALTALKSGKKVARAGWNGAGQYVYRVPAASYPTQTEAAKAEFGDMAPYRAYFALKTVQGDVAVWTPSTSDCEAEDWAIVS